jgi:phospholipase C
VIVTYDDSDGWYDHVIGPILNQSHTAQDALSGVGACGTGANALEAIQGRCGYGPRMPFVLVSPWAKANFVDHTVIDQSSVVRFIEDNWQLPRIGNGSFDEVAGSLSNMFDFDDDATSRTLILDPLTGTVVGGDSVKGKGKGKNGDQ